MGVGGNCQRMNPETFVEGVRVEEVKPAPSGPLFFFCTGENVFTWTTETGPRPSQLLCCLILGESILAPVGQCPG